MTNDYTNYLLWIKRFRKLSQRSELTYLMNMLAQMVSALVDNNRIIITHIYVMELLKLGWMVSGYHLKIYITLAQLRAANIGQAFLVVTSLAFRGIRPPFATLNLASASTTRAKT